MNIGIVGSRDFLDCDLLRTTIDNLRENYEVESIISGGARGADSLAKRYATQNDIPLVEHLAQWDVHGKSAGYIRNSLIWKDSDLIIAFWDGKSRGTKHTIDKYKGELLVVRY